jgi:hypothetical protein
VSRQRSKTEAFIWQGNPKKWHNIRGMNADIAHNSQYIYWSTPQYHDEIRIGDRAYVWRAMGDGPRGIIATGIVAEIPKEHLPHTASQFKHPERIGPGEEAASSIWKTGISILEVRLRSETGMLTAEILDSVCPELGILRNPRRTVYRVDTEQCNKIEALWANARNRD